MKLLLLLVAACAVPQPQTPASVRGDGPTGRLAGAPASLRPGVVSYPDVPVHAPAPPPHHHHSAP